MYGARLHSSIAGYRSFRNGRCAAVRLMGPYATTTRPHHTQGLARGGDWQSETLPSTLALPTYTSCFRAEIIAILRPSLCQSQSESWYHHCI
jgi:hypothetical protein